MLHLTTAYLQADRQAEAAELVERVLFMREKGVDALGGPHIDELAAAVEAVSARALERGEEVYAVEWHERLLAVTVKAHGSASRAAHGRAKKCRRH